MTCRPVAVALAVCAAIVTPSPSVVAAAPPAVSAPSAIVVETTSGEAVFERLAASRRPIASATKLMTALLALERSKLSDVVPAARYRALAVESKINLQPGEKLTMADLLRALLLASANDAAVTIAEHVSGSRNAFVRDMNARARDLGLKDTRFANPVGLDAPTNRSTARDLVTLTLELRKSSFFKRTVDRAGATLNSGSRPRAIANRNRLIRREPFVDGVKTGHTIGAGYVLVGSGTRNGVSLVSVVLGTASEAAREADTLALLRYGFKQFRRARPVRRGNILTRVPIRFREGAELDLIAGRSVTRVVRKGRRLRTDVAGVPAEIVGPVERGQRFGVVKVTDRASGELVAEVPLVAAAAVPAATVADRGRDYFTRPTTIALLMAVVLASVALALLRRRVQSASRRQQAQESWVA